MGLKAFVEKNYKILIFITLVAIAISLAFYKELGLKDSAMFFLATVMLLLEIYLIFKDKKKSILLFIISFPILVTARKVCYFDLLFIRVTYETIYVTLFFVINLKDVISKLKEVLKDFKTLEFKFIMLVFLFIIFALGSCIFSDNILHSISEVYISIIVPFFLMVSIIITFTKEDLGKIVCSLIISVDFSCVYGFSQVFSNHIPFRDISSNRDLLTFGYQNINIFAGVLMAVIPFLLQYLVYVKISKKFKTFLYISLPINLLALFLTYTRGAWITFIIVVFVILFSKKYRKLILALTAVGLIAAKPVLSYVLNRGTSTSILADESFIARIQSIFVSVKIIVLYPFGIGPGNFASMYQRYLEAGYMLMPESLRWGINVDNSALESAHNLWLQIGVEYGLVCLVVFLLIFINRIVACLKDYQENRANMLSIVTFLIFSILTGIEFNHKGVITGALILWIAFAMIELNRSKNQVS